MSQSELELENNLIKRLGGLGYEYIVFKDENELLSNLKLQLEKHNQEQLQKLGKTNFTENEFKSILTHLKSGNVFDRAEKLRDLYTLKCDDNETIYVEFFNKNEWCKNQYQVTNQVSQTGSYKNRYDVTLLVNGLPLVQIELKRRGLELKEAFNQINRYHRHSYWANNGLFGYVQIFVISNGVNTKYYANNRDQSFKQTFYWTDEKNNLITNLGEFADAFLEKCHLSKMIARYTVLQQSDKILMVLRPYQYYAVENIVDKVRNGRENGFIWHTTGSGKTLTSFKAAQILSTLPKVHKVLFVVDRADLDYQTQKEFNYFSAGCVDNTVDTASLVKQFNGTNNVIVTTIQKLNNAIKNTRHEAEMENQKDKRIVFIFDECHRSQFGDTHKNITSFFSKAQMFGFTGTPIFADNAQKNEHGKRTTQDLFGTCLHKYVITNAIKDENVLKFAVEYWGKFTNTLNNSDEEVAGINTKEVFEDDKRLDKITDWIIENHNKKTHNKDFTAMMAVSSVEALIKYYDLFKKKKLENKHDLRIATIFTFTSNEEDKDADGLISEPDFDLVPTIINSHSRDKLEEFITDYNQQYGTKHTTKNSEGFYNYYKDIAKRVKERDKKGFLDKDRVDILLVVNMYLTGFDAKKVNTLYVDKNLKYHGLIQAFSRTNRILSEVKSQGNIVCFRNLKNNTDEAIALFSDENAKSIILVEPYEKYVDDFNHGVSLLKEIAPTIDSVNSLVSEVEELKFIKAFRNLMRLLNVLKSFADFKFDDLNLSEQEFDDYKSKYLDLYDKTKGNGEDGETVSIINDVDFELELIARDEINVAYILQLLAKIKEDENSDDEGVREEAKARRRNVLDLLASEAQLRSKRELIEKFIEQNMPKIKFSEDVAPEFSAYWNAEREKAISDFCVAEGLKRESVDKIIAEHQFSGGKTPRREEIINALEAKPSVLERKSIIERVLSKLTSFIETFENMTGEI